MMFLDWTMGIPDELAAAIDDEVADEEGVTVKRLKSRWEERIEEEAIARGPARNLILRQLRRRCGPLDDAVRARIDTLSSEQVIALADALLDFTGRADLDRWLATHA